MWMHLLLKTSIRVKKLQHTSSSATGRPDTPLPPSPERVKDTTQSHIHGLLLHAMEDTQVVYVHWKIPE